MTANAAPARVVPQAAAKAKGQKISAQALSELAVPAAVLGIVIALIAPMPAFLLDLLIVADIMMSVIVLMVAMYITKPVDFNVFPTTLLMLTLFRLALNDFLQTNRGQPSQRLQKHRPDYGRRQTALPLQCGPPRPDRGNGDRSAGGCGGLQSVRSCHHR